MDTLSFNLFRAVVHDAINKQDPIRLLEIGAPDDEYDPEISTIIPRLVKCTSSEQVLDVVHQEFVAWFGATTAGRRNRYRALADELWTIAQKWR